VDDWGQIKARSGRLTLLLTPKELRKQS